MRLPKKTKPYHLKDVKFGLVISVIAISIIGVMVIGSAKQAVQGRQIIGLVAGVILMIILSMIDYVWLLNFYWILYGINIIALVCVKLFGTNVNGAQRWIDIGVTNFQPSELSKILVVVFFAKFLMNHEDDLNSAATILKAVGLIAPTLILIVSACFLCYDVSGGTELSIYRNPDCDSGSGYDYFYQYCCTAKSAISARLSAKAYSGMAGTAEICK